jgi:hypothetical protein
MLIGLAALVAMLSAFVTSAVASPTASWRIESRSATYFKPGGNGSYQLLARNLTDSIPVEEAKITDTLPPGVEYQSAYFEWQPQFSKITGTSSKNLNEFLPLCSAVGQQVTCTIPSFLTKFVEAGAILRGEALRMVVAVTVPSSTPEGPLVNEAVVEGGGGTASTSSQNAISSHPSFGISQLTVQPTEHTVEEFFKKNETFTSEEFFNQPYRTPFTQAGGRPWALTVTGETATEVASHETLTEGWPYAPEPVHDPRDIVVSLPPGLLANPMATPRCPLAFIQGSHPHFPGGLACPPDTQIGVYRVHDFGYSHELLAPIINVTPEAGQSAEFALENTLGNIFTPLLTAHLVHKRNPTTGLYEEYSFDVVSKSIPLVGLEKFELTFWGVPADPSHDSMRGKVCRVGYLSEPLNCEGGDEPSGVSPAPFLLMPTDCATGPEAATVRADSWQEPGRIGTGGLYEGFSQTTDAFAATTGCNALQFNAGTGIAIEPDTTLADEPVGLGVDLKVPLNETPGSNAAPLLRETRLTLPEGMSVSPGVVDGIKACDATGPEGINIEGPESEFVGPDGEWHLAPGRCPDASIVGTAEAITPFLPVPVKGHVYLAKPGCGGQGQAACTEHDAVDGNLYKLYLELGGAGELANTGIEFKVPLEVQVNPATGQLTTVARNLVQAPYNEVKIHLNGGPRAPLDNPSACGLATTSSDFVPWSAPGTTPEGLLVAGTPDLLSSSSFPVEGCSSPPPLHPGFLAGTVTAQAGQFSSFTMNLSRSDREQYIKDIQLHTPPGLLGMLSSVPLCGEPQANEGTCPQASKIGTVRVASGAGSHPFEIEGNVYLTQGHGGQPFGLSIATDAVAGPFNLGLVVVRARIAVNQQDSTLTITTDETGPYAVPQIIFGVPLRLQRVTVDIDRPGFMFNPTNCSPLQITATIVGSQDAIAPVSSPFAVGGCKSLAFKPKFTASTNGGTSRAKGASLDVKLSYPSGSMGSEANIAKVKVDLPRQLPSRLATLQKACVAATFETDPAACPKASIVGIARALTPLLPTIPAKPCRTRARCTVEPPTSVIGPVYFVSHGGAKFPSLIVVLQGDGVRVDLTGETFIKRGITSSTFRTIPDVPVNSFELYLPQSKNSALAANGNLCKQARKLKMPTEFVAQNGAVIKQSTQIRVTGCKFPGLGKQTRRGNEHMTRPQNITTGRRGTR